MSNAISFGDWCIGCKFVDACDGWFQMVEQADELGIEVDE